MTNKRGELKKGQPHPAAFGAKEYISKLGWEELTMLQESFSSCAIEGNELAKICSETLKRLTSGQPVGDRYLLGLAWHIRDMKENNGNNAKTKT